MNNLNQVANRKKFFEEILSRIITAKFDSIRFGGFQADLLKTSFLRLTIDIVAMDEHGKHKS